jgi:hypothetical protein
MCEVTQEDLLDIVELWTTGASTDSIDVPLTMERDLACSALEDMDPESSLRILKAFWSKPIESETRERTSKTGS